MYFYEKVKFIKFSRVLVNFTKVSKFLPYILHGKNSKDFKLAP